jgi:hypothetical protein
MGSNGVPYHYPRRPVVLSGDGVYDITIPMPLGTQPKLYQKFLTQTKHIIRASYEYRAWVKWVKDCYGPPVCAVSGNVVDIEVHHHPLVLTDYVLLGYQYLLDGGFSLTSFMLADLIIRWHYENLVGSAFMSATYHTRFHDLHDVEIPEDQIHGDFDSVVDHPILSKMGDVEKTKFCRFMPNFSENNPGFFFVSPTITKNGPIDARD